MEDSILYLFMEFASQVKEVNDSKTIEMLTQNTYQNLQNVLNFHRHLLNKTTQEMYPIKVMIQEGEPIQFMKV